MAIKTLFYQFSMGDVEDPEIYCAGPICDWQQTEYGKWCMENSTEQPSYSIGHDYMTYGFKCKVWGMLTEENYTYHQLKWSGYVNFNTK
jgi:hypothetical protein